MPEISRQYHSLTCSLTIAAKASPLCQWSEQLVVNHLRFQLSFLAGTVPEIGTAGMPHVLQDQPRLVIRGDRARLTALCQVVDDYLQDFLSTSGSLDDGLPVVSATTANAASSFREQDNRFGSPSGVRALKTEQPALTRYDRRLSLHSTGLFSHELRLGPLANKASGPVLPLSTLELSDLAEILDQCSNEFVALPTLQRSHLRSVPNWLRIAAVMVFAAGVTTTMSRLIDFSGTGLMTSTSPEAISDFAPTELPPGSSIPEASPPKASSPEQSNQLAYPQAAQSQGIQAAKQPKSSAFIPPNSSRSNPTPRRADLPAREQIVTAMPRVTPSNETLSAERSVPNRSENLGPQKTDNLYNQSNQFPLLGGGATTAGRPPYATPNAETSSAEIPVMDGNVFSPAPSAPAQPVDGVAASRAGASTGNQVLPPTEGTIHQTRVLPMPTTQPTPPPVAAGVPVPRSTDSNLRSQQGFSRDRNRPPNLSQQLTVIRQFFKKNWHPPENLGQPLEYRLFFADNGSLQDRIPLSPLAQDYLDRVGMPPLQQPFVPPFPTGSQPIIRLILQADGQVEAILEQVN